MGFVTWVFSRFVFMAQARRVGMPEDAGPRMDRVNAEGIGELEDVMTESLKNKC